MRNPIRSTRRRGRATIAGAAALAAYILTGPITGLLTLGETAWHEPALLNLAGSLAALVCAV